ncbi:33898_t:CDS:1, partial [Gigaspora margarita]
LNQTLLGNERDQERLITIRKTQYNNLLYVITERQIRNEQNKQPLADGERYDLIIQSIDESFLNTPRTLKTLQNLRRERYNSIIQSVNEKVKSVKNIKEAFDWLQDLLEKQEKIYEILNNTLKIVIHKYIKDFPKGEFSTKDEEFFNTENKKIEDYWYLEKQFLERLKKKLIDMYNDSEKDYYFINIEEGEDYDIFNNIQDFIDKIIKKNVIYMLIKKIFYRMPDSVRSISKGVK